MDVETSLARALTEYAEDEAGEQDAGGWYGYVGMFSLEDMDTTAFDLNLDEEQISLLTDYIGDWLIVTLDEMGFGYIKAYDTEEEAKEAWAEILAELEPAQDEEDED